MTRRRGRSWWKEQPDYKAEGELCDRFGAAIQAKGWQVFPEVAEWDLLLVSPDGAHQVGVEAKLRCNLEVVSAITQRARRRQAPHLVGALVPKASPQLGTVCQALGFHAWDHFTILDLEGLDPMGTGGRSSWSAAELLGLSTKKGYRHGKGLKLPEVPLVGGGGRASPKVMSPWRVRALRLCALLEARGWLSSQDFRTHEVDITRWRNARWIVREGDAPRTDGKPGVWACYVRGDQYDRHGPAAGYRAELELVRAKYGLPEPRPALTPEQPTAEPDPEP